MDARPRLDEYEVWSFVIDVHRVVGALTIGLAGADGPFEPRSESRHVSKSQGGKR